jgi:hypothetical protein
MSLTLSSFPRPPPIPDSGTVSTAALLEPAIVHVLESLLPASVQVPLSIDFLNLTPFTPTSKDDDLNSGVLQLPEGTAIVITDANVSEGTLGDRKYTSTFFRSFSHHAL